MATFFVVLNHSVEAIYQLNLEYVSMMSIKTKWFCFGAFTAGRTGVLIFFWDGLNKLHLIGVCT